MLYMNLQKFKGKNNNFIQTNKNPMKSFEKQHLNTMIDTNKERMNNMRLKFVMFHRIL